MISISTYTEQIPVTADINEFPQFSELEELEESRDKGSFAELLAGLLRNADKPQEFAKIDNYANDANVEALGGDELKEIQQLHLLKETIIPEAPSDTKVPIEEIKDLNILTGAQRLFYDLEAEAVDASEGEFYKGLSNLIRADMAPEAELDAGFFDQNAGKTEIHFDAEQIANAAKSIQDVIAEINSNKEKAENSALKNAAQQELARIDNIDVSDAETLAGLQNEKPGKLDEARGAKVKNRGFAMEINDMRTKSAEGAAGGANGGAFSAIEASATRVQDAVGAREITLELRIPEQNNALNQANTSWEAKAGGALENLLARELHQSFNGDIVRHAFMALKDGGEGTIKIALKPESLGNVKIALELADNKITGKIFVESEEALNAFRKEIASLEQAFKDSGFAAADLNLSLSSNGQNADMWNETERSDSLMPQTAASASQYEENLVTVFIGHKKSSINLLA